MTKSERLIQPERLTKTLVAIDEANQQDPNIEMVDGNEVPKELIYGQRMSEELSRFMPEAGEHLQIAVRAQHIERWNSPRSDYPEGRSGYKKWRSQLILFHARRAGEIMQIHGYDDEAIERVRYIIQKRRMKSDIESQTLEDVVCLVFLRYYLEAFAAKHNEEKLIDIVRKTWGKMSDNGQKAALKIDFSEEISIFLQKCLD